MRMPKIRLNIKKVLLWTGAVLGTLVGVLVVLFLVLMVLGTRQINKTYDIQVAAVDVPTDPASIERGKHIVDSLGLCSECHGEGLSGDMMSDDPIFGTLAASNLTAGRGGIGATYTDIDYVRAIRHGVGKDNKPLIVMPAQYFNKFSDADLGAIIAYLKSLPPVDNEPPRTSLAPPGRVFAFFAKEILPAREIDHDAPRPASPEIGVTKEYGEYLTVTCTLCHGELCIVSTFGTADGELRSDN